MYESSKLVFLNFIFLLATVQICRSEPAQHLSLHSPETLATEADYLEVLVRRIGDNLTLVCEIKGDKQLRLFVWNYVAVNGSSSHRAFTIDPTGPTSSSSLLLPDLQLEDSGQYLCSSPPFSVTKFVLVQPPPEADVICARGAFSCGDRCVLPTYVCDGRSDCRHGEDEAPPLCPPSVCQRSGMLNCSSGRCISASACCPATHAGPLCLQHSCCSEHDPYRTEGFVEVDFPASFEDKHAPDQYGFIQSTIYTVTACALIFMIAAVLLVSAICKMHMKRAALRSYARAAAQRHYTHHPPPRYPPCYEASRLLEQAANAPPLEADINMQTTPDPVPDDNPDPAFGLSRLSSIFSSRYRQVPTTGDVEMTTVRPSSLNGSPARRPRLRDYRSPTYDDINNEYFLNAETGNCARELNYMSPVEMYRNRLDLDRRLTLQLGRFQLSLPRFGRERPGTPNVAEINIHDLDFVRHASDTYTLNGRTIRLLGANFSSVPHPPPYPWRKAGGPPPSYVRADNADQPDNDEMPPRYSTSPPPYPWRKAGGPPPSYVRADNADQPDNDEMPPRYSTSPPPYPWRKAGGPPPSYVRADNADQPDNDEMPPRYSTSPPPYPWRKAGGPPPSYVRADNADQPDNDEMPPRYSTSPPPYPWRKAGGPPPSYVRADNADQPDNDEMPPRYSTSPPPYPWRKAGGPPPSYVRADNADQPDNDEMPPRYSTSPPPYPWRKAGGPPPSYVRADNADQPDNDEMPPRYSTSPPPYPWRKAGGPPPSYVRADNADQPDNDEMPPRYSTSPPPYPWRKAGGPPPSYVRADNADQPDNDEMPPRYSTSPPPYPWRKAGGPPPSYVRADNADQPDNDEMPPRYSTSPPPYPWRKAGGPPPSYVRADNADQPDNDEMPPRYSTSPPPYPWRKAGGPPPSYVRADNADQPDNDEMPPRYSTSPPPYPWRKAGGPPPSYVRADNADQPDNDEMPPRYEDVNSNEERIERVTVSLNAIRESAESLYSTDNVVADNADNDNYTDDQMNSILRMIDNIPAIDDVNANEIVGE